MKKEMEGARAAAVLPEPGTVAASREPKPPCARLVPHRLEVHGHVRVDPYYWLREREDPQVIAHLEAENAYADTVLAPIRGLQAQLYDEIIGRIKKTDMSVPYKLGDYWYYDRYEGEGEYPIYCRKRGSLEAAEEIILDVNELAEGREYFAVRDLDVSPGQDLLAYATDAMGRRIYTLRFKNLTTGETLPDVIPGVTGNSVWANDNRTVFYTRLDPETLRSHHVVRHVLGTDPAADELIYAEDDEAFSVWVKKTKSKKYLLLLSHHHQATEVRILDADDPAGEPRVFMPRKPGHEHAVEHYGEHFYVRTNLDAKNFRLIRTPVDDVAPASWREVVAHRTDVFLADFEIFRDYLVLSERREGLIHLRVMPWDGGEEHWVDFGEPAYQAFATTNLDFETRLLRYSYNSMTTPLSTYDYDLATREKTLLKQQEVLGGFDPGHYVTERLHAPARDGREIPLSIVYRKELLPGGGHPLVLYGYGAYGLSVDPTFSAARLSLLDRGFTYAIAHVRGGQELGREWYDDGRLLRKENTFNDFIDAAEHLIARGYTSEEKLFAYGGSAGGLLLGTVINRRPELFRGIVSRVPFVDVVTTMLDPTIPLTTGEYEEWGDPNDPVFYESMLSYSPYDNLEPKGYPHVLVLTGLHDSQVQYWEPAKWVAKLRATKTDANRLLLVTNMDAGHGGASGRFKAQRETALIYAFLLDLAGLATPRSDDPPQEISCHDPSARR